MSHNLNINYGYPCHQNYYIEEPEEFIPDYSDSEALSENPQILQTVPHSNVTELYSRKLPSMIPQQQQQQQMIPNDIRYQQNQNQYMQECYYEHPQAQLTRTQVAVPMENYAHSYDPRMHQYCPLTTASQHDTNYDSAAYRSAHHNIAATHHPNIPRGFQETMSPPPIQKQSVKRYPITVGTPKYYRKPPANSIYKRPSALCLPVASQPDPAVHRRQKKPVSEPQYGVPQQIPHQPMESYIPNIQPLKQESNARVPTHTVGSEGDVNKKMSNLEGILERLEKDSNMLKARSKTELAKIAKFMKPRVPASVKERQEKLKQKTIEMMEGKIDSSNKNTISINVPKVTEDSLDKLLTQLKKCEFGVNKDGVKKSEVKSKNHYKNTANNGNESSEEKTDEEYKAPSSNKSLTKSFNYQDITNQMVRSKSDSKTCGGSIGRITAQSSIEDITKRLNLSLSDSRQKSAVTKPPLDDHCALELHRSKSYIVNLIDRALSKELGTVPSDRGHKEFNNAFTRKAVESMNRHICGKSDKELCLEITSALTDSIISTATAPEMNQQSLSSYSKSKVCCCNAEEPTYIKQLKQLRWGHLKHIQREVRRLEDLERFLDSCSLNTISEL